jgi:hypothetical protein
MGSFHGPLKQSVPRRNSSSQGEADPGDDFVPLPLFSCRIIYQHTIHVPVGVIAAIVPGPPVPDAGNSEKARGYSLILNARRRPPFLKEFAGRVILGIWNGLQREICATVLGEKATPGPALGGARVFGKY